MITLPISHVREQTVALLTFFFIALFFIGVESVMTIQSLLFFSTQYFLKKLIK